MPLDQAHSPCWLAGKGCTFLAAERCAGSTNSCELGLLSALLSQSLAPFPDSPFSCLGSCNFEECSRLLLPIPSRLRSSRICLLCEPGAQWQLSLVLWMWFSLHSHPGIFLL